MEKHSLARYSMVTRASGAFAACFLLAFLAACHSQPSGDVMASVDGRKIFRSDVDKYYENQVASAQQAPIGEQATALRLNILHQMIDDEILMRRAEKLGLLATDEEVDRKYNEIKSPYTQEEFDQRLKDKKISLADFKRDIRRAFRRAESALHARGISEAASEQEDDAGRSEAATAPRFEHPEAVQ